VVTSPEAEAEVGRGGDLLLRPHAEAEAWGRARRRPFPEADAEAEAWGRARRRPFPEAEAEAEAWGRASQRPSPEAEA
jgi:hypothetical protein